MHIKFTVTSDVLFELDVNKDQIAQFLPVFTISFLNFDDIFSSNKRQLVRIERSYQQTDYILHYHQFFLNTSFDFRQESIDLSQHITK